MSIKDLLCLVAFLISSGVCTYASDKDMECNKICIAYTTDIHGCFFPVDHIRMEPMGGSLARVHARVDSLRGIYGRDNVILLDNGDLLQGQPAAYYYNYIDTVSPHIASGILDFMGYDAVGVGNHDIETGHAVYDRVRRQNPMPVLCANVVDVHTGEPYFTPYVILNRGGRKVGVLGLITPAIPFWLPQNLWAGMRFEDMEECASKWIRKIRDNENPDFIIGLFHSGTDASKTTGDVVENASLEVARRVAGFDAVLAGHDHRPFVDKIVNTGGNAVWVLNAGSNANRIGVVEISESKSGEGASVSAWLEEVSDGDISEEFVAEFKTERGKTAEFVDRPIGYCHADLFSNDALFGPSGFMTLLHKLQLSISGAQISFAAPLQFDAVIHGDTVRVRDMFSLYKYENMLYTLSLTGCEIKDYLEYSYNQWINTVSPGQPHLLRFASANPESGNNRLANPIYNFDSAAGINYTVDITKEYGERVEINSLADGTPFYEGNIYSVAVNSYRATGGGNHFTKGAHIGVAELESRVIRATDRDLRYYLLHYIESNPEISGSTDFNWRFIPGELAASAVALDRPLIFSDTSLQK